MSRDDNEFKILMNHIVNRRGAALRLVGGDDEFKILLGRIGNQGHHKSFLHEVQRARRKAGPMAGKKGSSRHGHSTFGRGRAAFGPSRLFGAHRRIVVEARVIRQKGGPSDRRRSPATSPI
jgi:hypothetical protein